MTKSTRRAEGNAETTEEMWKVCPVCGKRYPGPLGHACTGATGRVRRFGARKER